MTDYTLEIVTASPLTVRLVPPGGGEMQSTRIAFLPGPRGGCIAIYGDYCERAIGRSFHVISGEQQ